MVPNSILPGIPLPTSCRKTSEKLNLGRDFPIVREAKFIVNISVVFLLLSGLLFT
jgi:hypothetical protein